jgi:beta-lactamase class A
MSTTTCANTFFSKALTAVLASYAFLVVAGFTVLAQPSIQARAQDRAAESQSDLLWHALEDRVRQTERTLDGTLGVAILDLTDGRTSLVNPDLVFAQASSIKLAVLAELYRQEQRSEEGVTRNAKLADFYTVDAADLVEDSAIMGGLTPGVTRVTNRDLATFMVAVSDNTAANVLIDRLGMQNVNAMFESLGLKNTRLQRKMMDLKAAKEGRENISTPREMLTLLSALYRGKVLSPELTRDFFKVLGTRKESEIPRYIPEDVICANKPGELPGVRNDIGIVFVPNRPFAIVVMTAYLKHERDGEEAIAKIAGDAYAYFDRVSRASPYGRILVERSPR